MPILGIGNDIVKILRFLNILKKHGVSGKYTGRLARRILHEEEILRFNRIAKTGSLVQAGRFLAGSWATKEAIFKSLDTIRQKRFVFSEWRKENDESGRPQVKGGLSNEKFWLSISHDGDYLTAVVVREV